MPYIIPSSAVTPGTVYQPRAGLPGVIKSDARAIYATGATAFNSTRILDLLPSHNGTRRTGEQGRSYTADGVDDEVNFGDIGTAIWFSGWVKLNSDNQCLFSLSNDTNTNLVVSAGVLTAGATLTLTGIKVDDVSKTASEAGALINDNLWHFLSCGIGDGLGGASTADDVRYFTDGTNHGSVSGFDWRFWATTPTAEELTECYTGDSANRNSAALSKYALWSKMDEQSGTTTYDSSGNGNDGTITNATLATFHATQDIWSFQNQVGYGNFYLGDGATGYLTVNQSTSTPLDGENWTVAYKCSKLLNTAGSTLFSAGNSGNHTYFTIFHWASSNQLQIFARWDSTNTTNDLFTLPNGSINDNSQHDIIVRKSGTDLRLYVDGVLEKTITLSQNETMSTNNKPFTLLALNRATVSDWFASPLYNLRAWDVAIDLSEIANITSGSTPTSGLWGHWVLNSLSDLSGNGYDLEINGTVYQQKTPRDESDTTNDVLGNPLTNIGRRPNDAKLNDSNCLTADGTLYIAAAHLAGSETVVSSGGTSTPSISAGRIDFTAGTCWDLTLSDGTHYPLSEGGGIGIHDDSGAGSHGILTNATLASAWGGSQDDYHNNITSGFVHAYQPTVQIYSGAQASNIKNISFKFRSTDTNLIIFSDNTPSLYLIYCATGSASTAWSNGISGMTLEIDGSTTWGTTIGDLYNALCDGDVHQVIITNLSFQLSWATDGIYINKYTGNLQWDATTYLWDLVATDSGGNILPVQNPPSVRLPAVTSSLGPYSIPLTNPAGDYHNNAETTIDFNPDSTPEMGTTQLGITVPASHAFGDAWAASDQIFSRQRTLTEDRFVVMPEAQTGSALATIQRYTQP